MTFTRVLLASAFVAGLVGTAIAERLPKDAVKLNAEELRAIYAGKTSNWSRSNAYFAPDGSYFVVAKNNQFVAHGTWSIKGNELCAEIQVRGVKDGGTKKATDCWSWFRHGKRYLTFWSGEKNKKDGYYEGELKKLSSGDTVTSRYQKLTASN